MSALAINPAVGRFTSPYGPRKAPAPGASTWHRGVDIAPPRPGQKGVVVRAATAGRVLSVAHESVRGRIVRVDVGGGVQLWYQHLASTSVRKGQAVKIGQKIGVMGKTGMSSGEHLHLEVRTSGVPVDPETWLGRRGVSLGKSPHAGRYVVDKAKVKGSRLLGRAAPGGKVLYRRRAGFKITAVGSVTHKGRYYVVTAYGTFYALDYLRKA